MTPIEKSTGGFVTLGKWVDESHTKLEIIGVKIPYGYTLIVEKDCIYGDTNLSGKYMMCMTSNHITMRTADTVFLKSTITKKNLPISIAEDEDVKILSSNYPSYSFGMLSGDFSKEGVLKNNLRTTGTVFNPIAQV